MGEQPPKNQVSFRFANRPFTEEEFKDEIDDNEERAASVVSGMSDVEDILFSPWERVRAKKTAKARSFLIEMVAYLLFIVLFCLTTFALRSQWIFWSSESVRSTVKINGGKNGFFTVGDTQGFYSYMEGVFVPNVYSTHWYNGNEKTTYEKRFSGMQNRLVGTTRLRQIRVDKNVDCRVSDKFKNFVKDCYPPYSSAAEATAAYGPPHNRTKYRHYTTGTLCQFSPVSRHCSSLTTGKTGQSYPSSGYVVDLPLSQAAALQMLAEMKTGGYVDQQTRAIAIDFTMYNANTRLLVVTQLLVEWLPTGSVTTKASIKPTPTLQLETDGDRAALALEIMLALYLFCYLINEVTDFYRYKKISREQCIKCKKAQILRRGLEKRYICLECRNEFNPFKDKRCGRCLTEYNSKKHLCWRGYFQDPWHWLDVINLIFFVIVFGLRFQLRSDLADLRFESGSRFMLLVPVAGQFSISNYLNSVNALLCFIKTFKYLGKFQQLSVLIKTLSNSREEIFYFLVIFAVIFVGFALAFQLGFGSDVEEYRSFTDSLMSLFRMLLGEFNYYALENSNRVLAPLFFTFYNVLVLFVLSNMFIAIVSGAYATAITESGPDDEFLSSSLKLFYNGIKVKFDRLVGNESMLTDVLLLIERLEQIPDLTSDQQGDITIFKNEVEHNPEDNEMFNFVLSAFDRRVNREMTLEDFQMMKTSVTQFKQSQVEEEDGDSPPSTPQNQAADIVREDSVQRTSSRCFSASERQLGSQQQRNSVFGSQAQMVRKKSSRYDRQMGAPMMSFHQQAATNRVKLLEDNISAMGANIGLVLAAIEKSNTLANEKEKGAAAVNNERIANRRRVSQVAGVGAGRDFSIGGHGPRGSVTGNAGEGRSPAKGSREKMAGRKQSGARPTTQEGPRRPSFAPARSPRASIKSSPGDTEPTTDT